ncbi:MAG: hypothetical protein GC138_01815 [Gammaproteobacteria bacterium]|nr:hypothetical protein [Gammaproteobacteria bacterium]
MCKNNTEVAALLFVNGVEYSTTGVNITVNGAPATEADLQTGMHVDLTGSKDANGSTGTALSIAFDDDLEGIVEQAYNGATTPATPLKVMGYTILTDATTEFSSQVSGQSTVADIAVGNIVEVSGTRLDNTTIQASYIETKAAFHSGQEIEVKGAVTALDSINMTFQIGAMTVDYSAVSSMPSLANDLFVEVKSTAGKNGSGNLVASAIELASNGTSGIDGTEGKEFELSGPIGTGSSSTQFTLNGTTVIVSSETQFEHGAASDIADGAQVEVSGTLNANGQIDASEIAFREAEEAELQGSIEAIDTTAVPNTVTIMGATIAVNNKSMFKDNSTQQVRYFNQADLAVGDWLEIGFYRDNTTSALVAVKVKRENSGTNQLEGVVEAVGTGTVTVSGVAVDLSGVTSPPTLTVNDQVHVNGTYDANTHVLMATSVTL